MVSLGQKGGTWAVHRRWSNRDNPGEKEEKRTVHGRWSSRVSPVKEEEQDQFKRSVDIPKSVWKRRTEVYKDEGYMPSGAKGAK